ncbi:molybdate ABC transporter substrate-binding protein [Oscillatoria sp. FACHB-1406]|nr:molybdate ABC transporter substrate-binding protein [Oscillatoria sp. FACHB-1406]
MKKTRFLAFLLIATISFFLTVACERLTTTPNVVRNTPPTVQLTVSAAASLKDAMEAIKPVYLAKNSETAIAYNFGSSGSLQQQVEQGAPVDVFVAAAAKQMDNLQKKGLLIDETRQDLLTNQLVLIVPKENTKIKGFKDLPGDAAKKIALGEPESVPAGKYAKETLTFFKLFDAVKAKAVYAKDVRQVLNYVETGNTEAGIVYETDAKTSDRVKIVEIAPSNSHARIVYPIAVIKASKHIEAAKQFVQFLSSPEAKTMFEKYGFKRA